MVSTILIYLITYAIYGEGTPKELYDNITAYAGGFRAATLLDLWYPSSLLPLKLILEGEAQFPVINALGSQTVEIAAIIVRAIILIVTLSIIAAAAAAWWRPQVVPMHRLVLLSIAMATINSEVGGYTHMLLIYFVFMERWRGFGRPAAIVIAFLLCIALEIPLEQVPPALRDSYLSGRWVIVHYYVGIGAILRPLLIHLMILALSLVTIRDVWCDARRHGWRSPLARWRAGTSQPINEVAGQP